MQKIEILRINYMQTERDKLGNLQVLYQVTFCSDCRFFELNDQVVFDIDDPPHGICDHESNWRPSRGELQIWADCNCEYFQPKFAHEKP